MNKADTIKILALLRSTYPSAYKDIDDTTIEIQVDLWADIFANQPYEIVQLAAKAYIKSSSSGFAPAPGQINQIIYELQHPRQIDGAEVWEGCVMPAIRDGHYNAVKGFSSLPNEAKRLIGSPERICELSDMDLKSLEVEKSHFVRSYNARADSDKKYELLSEIRDDVLALGEKCVKQIGAKT